jgi:hypothetical protein
LFSDCADEKKSPIILDRAWGRQPYDGGRTTNQMFNGFQNYAKKFYGHYKKLSFLSKK